MKYLLLIASMFTSFFPAFADPPVRAGAEFELHRRHLAKIIQYLDLRQLADYTIRGDRGALAYIFLANEFLATGTPSAETRTQINECNSRRRNWGDLSVQAKQEISNFMWEKVGRPAGQRPVISWTQTDEATRRQLIDLERMSRGRAKVGLAQSLIASLKYISNEQLLVRLPGGSVPMFASDPNHVTQFVPLTRDAPEVLRLYHYHVDQDVFEFKHREPFKGPEPLSLWDVEPPATEDTLGRPQGREESLIMANRERRTTEEFIQSLEGFLRLLDYDPAQLNHLRKTQEGKGVVYHLHLSFEGQVQLRSFLRTYQDLMLTRFLVEGKGLGLFREDHLTSYQEPRWLHTKGMVKLVEEQSDPSHIELRVHTLDPRAEITELVELVRDYQRDPTETQKGMHRRIQEALAREAVFERARGSETVFNVLKRFSNNLEMVNYNPQYKHNPGMLYRIVLESTRHLADHEIRYHLDHPDVVANARDGLLTYGAGELRRLTDQFIEIEREVCGHPKERAFLGALAFSKLDIFGMVLLRPCRQAAGRR